MFRSALFRPSRTLLLRTATVVALLAVVVLTPIAVALAAGGPPGRGGGRPSNPAPAPSELTAPVLFGDSLTYMAQDDLMDLVGSANLENPIVWGIPGYTLGDFSSLVRAAIDQGWPTITLALGTNDALTSRDLRTWRMILRDLDRSPVCTVFVRPYRSPALSSAGRSFLDALDAEVARVSSVHVVDWASIAAENPEHHPDTIHHDDYLQDRYAETLFTAMYETCPS